MKMASDKLNSLSDSNSTSEDEDDFCGSVKQFSSIFANIQREKEMEHTESLKVVHETQKRKSKEEKRLKKKESEVASAKKEESKEEKLEKIRQEMEANMDIDELRLLDDLDDILIDKKISPKRQIELECISDTVEVPDKKSKKSRKGRKKGRASSPEVVAVPDVNEVSDTDLLEVEDITPVQEQPTKFAGIQVSWKENTFIYTPNLYDKVSWLRQRISKRTDTRAEEILLYLGEDTLEDDKTLMESGVKKGDTLEAMTVPKSKPGCGNRDPAMLELKCQTVNRRETFHVYIRKTTSLEQLRKDVAEKLKLAPENVKLQFDGETLDLEETPESMEFEDGYCIDVFTS